VAGGWVTLLAIESATDTVGVALIRDDGASAERIHEGGRAHAELLVPSIEEVCAASGCTIGQVGCIAVDTGPGLFTGLRVGVATAKALAQALGVGVLAVSSLDTLAAAAAERSSSEGASSEGAGAVVSVVDARRGEVFAAVYRFDLVDERSRRVGGGDPPTDPSSVCEGPLDPLRPDALVDWLVGVAQVAGRVTVVGDGAVRYRHLLSVQGPLDLGWADELSAPPPLVLARLALRRLGRGAVPLEAAELVPDYRRPADARINWEQRAPRPGGGTRGQRDGRR
jgi:tRNA threonylcarbamoyladenosine biosynthesis protein TsaB